MGQMPQKSAGLSGTLGVFVNLCHSVTAGKHTFSLPMSYTSAMRGIFNGRANMNKTGSLPCDNSF